MQYVRSWRARAVSLLLAAVMVLGFLPALPGGEAEAHWADDYLAQMADWGLIRADQVDSPNDALTRADFMSIVNRAYGYHVPGPTPFEDVSEYDWFYDDVGIAYTAKYIQGTSETTASPNDPLDRETAATILGRNMMLQDSPGEIMDFSDARQISNWSRGTIKASLEHYLVSGYDDGTFRPQRDVSWGEMAALMSRTIGTPIQAEGDYTLGGVFGNVTISSPGVTLRDTVISGDLYVTGGVGLGNIKLENVTVLGRIIASGTGESESGGASILMRNVIADELLVDNLQDNYVTIQADGITEIGKTTVRTSAYIEDNTPDGLGLKYIELNGDEGIQLDLAGRVEEVVNKTPGSLVQAAKGTVAKLTVDEDAVNATLDVNRGAEVKELNLDVATNVTGQGDVEKLNVNAPGSIVTMLPDEIQIRPGITAVINGQEMDSTGADESSREPLILSGYPMAADVAPNSISAVFATNKRGTIHWAVSAITDGSVGVDDLIKPPAYGSIAVQRGTVLAPQGDEEVTAAVTGLLSGGSYYLSAVLVDERGNQSPLKVIAFTTPDNTVPAFNQGYPYMSLIEDTRGQATVMANKDCVMYYALLPQGAQAPTPDELRTARVTGNLGYGVRTLSKNTADVFWVNDLTLEEQETYTVYFWLTDLNGANSSAVTSLTFTTVDRTPPEFIVEPTVNNVQTNSVGLTFRLNETGVVFWAVVEAGADYPKPKPGESTILLTDDYAKLQVSSGLNAIASGRVNATENIDGAINVTGLEPEKAYDLYYVAQDAAGNWSYTVKKITISTLDTNGPKITQHFTQFIGEDDTKRPVRGTDIVLEFSENVRYAGTGGGDSFWDLWEAYQNAVSSSKATAWQRLRDSIEGSIKLYKQNPLQGKPELVPVIDGTLVTPENSNEYIDYGEGKIELSMKEGKLLVKFLNEGLSLNAGSTYYFEISNLTDTSAKQNVLSPSPVNFNTPVETGHNVPVIEIEFAQVNLVNMGGAGTTGPYAPKRTAGNLADVDKDANNKPIILNPDATGTTDDEKAGTLTDVHMSFRLLPNSTETVDENISYDILLFSDTSVSFDLFYRVTDASGKVITEPGKDWARDAANEKNLDMLPTQDGYGTADANGWVYLGYSGDISVNEGNWGGRPINGFFGGCTDRKFFPPLKNLNSDYRYEFVVTLKKVSASEKQDEWNGTVNFRAYVAAGQTGNLNDLRSNFSFKRWESIQQGGLATGAKSIGVWTAEGKTEDYVLLPKSFTDSTLPYFASGSPTFTATDSHVTMSLTLNREGYVYYAIGRADVNGENGTEDGWQPDVTTIVKDPTVIPDGKRNIKCSEVPRNGTEAQGKVPSGQDKLRTPPIPLDEPKKERIFDPRGWEDGAKAITGNATYRGVANMTVEVPQELESDTTYYIYIVIKGEADDLSEVFIYKFTTTPVKKPKITINSTDDGAMVSTDIAADVEYLIYTEENYNKLENLKNLKLSAYSNLGSDQELPDAYKDYTLKQALLEPYEVSTAMKKKNDKTYIPGYGTPNMNSYNGFSVFDIYASAGMRQQVGQWIRSGSSENLSVPNTPQKYEKWEDKSGGPISVAPNQIITPNDKIFPGTNYAIVVVARNSELPDNTLNDSYRMYFPVSVVRSTPPELVNASATLSDYDPQTQRFTGRISLIFDRPLYSGKDLKTEITAATFFPAGTPPAGFDTPVFNNTKEGASVELSFTNAPISSGFLIARAYFSALNGPPTNKDLNVEFIYGQSENGGVLDVTGAYIRITWGDGSGTPKTWTSNIISNPDQAITRIGG
ncbi:MAG: S-layer homology domain-containing protein [Oscillospiraceae bacterium]|nr:S-layer homology domain-containing protein [Oscillospiraceae bacterium]